MRFAHKNPDHGDVMTVEEFRQNIEAGGFIDDDGFAYLSNGTHNNNAAVYPSEFMEWGKTLPVGATHVVWFNR